MFGKCKCLPEEEGRQELGWGLGETHQQIYKPLEEDRLSWTYNKMCCEWRNTMNSMLCIEITKKQKLKTQKRKYMEMSIAAFNQNYHLSVIHQSPEDTRKEETCPVYIH